MSIPFDPDFDIVVQQEPFVEGSRHMLSLKESLNYLYPKTAFILGFICSVLLAIVVSFVLLIVRIT